MTALGPLRPISGSAASAGRPVGTLLALLVVGLLFMLPCAGTAKAAVPSGTPGTPAAPATGHPHSPAPPTAAPTATATKPAAKAGHTAPLGGHPANAAQSRTGSADLAWCSADDLGQRPGDGCSSHPCPGQDAQLPNAPPQPVPATLPQLVTVVAGSSAAPANAPAHPVTAPDLHLLQVNRT